MKKTELEEYYTRKGLKKDSYGNFKTASGMTRYKMQKTSVRKERKVIHSSGGSSWIKIWGHYYKNLYITSEDKIGKTKK